MKKEKIEEALKQGKIFAIPREPLMKRPTLEMIELHAAKIGLPPREAKKFWYFYESKGWIVGNRRMKNWHMAMAGWKMRYDEKLGPAQKSIIQKDLEKQLDWIERRR